MAKKEIKDTIESTPSDLTLPKADISSETPENLNFDDQTRDMLKRVRDQKLVSGGLDPFYVSDKDKKSNFSYKWASSDKDAAESISYLEDMGWKKVEGYRTVPTGGYTIDGQPGKHILMSIQKIVHDELVKIQNELNERKRSAIYGSEILLKDGGKNKMGSSVKKDDANFLNK